ncbi:MAG: hypothetical protein GVY24_04400 [Planctomycetes bacterium]|jgi:ribonuclease Z|nr:hypothetical protein [Planctomycetota bacterium]
MLPREPARRPQLGFLYVHPYRIQGISIAGEESAVHVPELDVCFDIGACEKPMLTAKYVALTHGHMDHSAQIAYYFSQRNFQGMGTGTLLCHEQLEKPIHNLMNAWVDVEHQRTPYNLIPMKHEDELEVKNNIVLRAFETRHTVPSLGFVMVEKRSKLKDEFVGLPQEKLVELKAGGTAITQINEIPLIAYTGDTAWGPHFERGDVMNAKVLITECTFLEPGDHKRAAVGKHLHLKHVADLVESSTAEAVVLTHLSRRTHITTARAQLDKMIPAHHRQRVHLLMDSRTNRQRYEAQVAAAETAGSASAAAE